MTFWQFLNDNWGPIFLFTFLFGGSLAAWVYKFIHRLLDHRERQTKEKTRQLELQLKIAERQKPRLATPKGGLQPKQSYEQPDVTPYEQGYQIQIQYGEAEE